MRKADAIQSYVQAEIDRFKGEGGSFVDECEAIAKIAFYMAILRVGFPEQEKFESRMEVAICVAEVVVEQMPGSAVMKQVEPS